MNCRFKSSDISSLPSYDIFISQRILLPFTTNEMISISTLLTLRSVVVIFHFHRPMVFLSLSLYDTPELAPRANVLIWGPGNFPVSYSNRDTSWNDWNSHSESFMADRGYEVSLSRMLNDILTLPFYLSLHRIGVLNALLIYIIFLYLFWNGKSYHGYVDVYTCTYE